MEKIAVKIRPLPNILTQVRCFIPRAIFRLHDFVYLLVVFPNPCTIWESGVEGKQGTKLSFSHTYQD